MNADLYAAATAGDIDGIMRMREKIDQVTDTKATILYLAALFDKSDCVAFILDEFPGLLNMVNSRNETALHLATEKGYLDVAKVLIQKVGGFGPEGINFIRKGNVDLDTALHLAARNDRSMVVDLIVKADPNDEHSQNLNSETPLYSAAVNGNSGLMNTILSTCTKAGVGGPEGRTALHAAVMSGNHYCIHRLRRRPDLFGSVDDKGWTAIHYAASLNNELALDELIDMFEESQIHNELFGLESPHESMDAVMAMTTLEQKTAYHIAALEGNIYVLTKLMKCYLNGCTKVDADGRNILHIAAMQNHTELIQSIVQEFPSVLYGLLSEQDQNGNTPLHLLVIAGCYVPQIMKIFSWQMHIGNNDGFTPQDLLYKDDNIIGDQLLIKKAFQKLTVNRRRFLWFGETESAKRQETVVQPSTRRKKDAKFKIAKTTMMKEEVRLYRERTNTQIIVTALIATVTFTVGFTMPGGNHDGDTGDADNGLAILSKKAAFNICIVADAIGLLFSASALFLYFMSSMYQDPHDVSKFNAASTGFNIVSVVAMMLTFLTGTYVVLSHSPAIAITVSVISCVFFLLVIVLLIKWKYDPIEKFKV